MKYRILTICGSGIATSTVAAEKMRQMLNDKGYDVDVVECNALDVPAKLDTFRPHAVVPTTTISDSVLRGIRRFQGLAFITGIGMDKVVEEIAAYLDTIQE